MDPQDSRPITSGTNNTGDIIISPTTPAHKSKAPLVIVAAITVLIAIGGLVFLSIAPNFSKNDNTTNSAVKSSIPQSVFNKFTNYANYLLAGQHSNQPIQGNYDINFEYQINTILWSQDIASIKGFLGTIYNDFQNFYQDFEKHCNQNDELYGTVRTYKESLEFVIGYIMYHYDVNNDIVQNSSINSDFSSDSGVQASIYVNDLISGCWDIQAALTERLVNG